MDHYSSVPSERGAVSKLTTLLDADPVDLAQVGDAIRAQPDLESLVLKVCGSLALTLGIPVCSAEEAAIALGKDRLRILVRAWSARRSGDPSGGYGGDVFVRDLLLLMPLVEPMLLTPEQQAALREMLHLCP